MNTIGKLPATTQDVETAIENAVDKLAIMINEGFKTTATKDDINRLEGRLGKIENLLMEEQRRKIENLEARMKRLEDALAV
jgi:archaellum component FlaC